MNYEVNPLYHCNYQQPVLFWSIIILTVCFFYYFLKQTTRTQGPSPQYCSSSTVQNSKLFSHPLFTFYWLYTRERCGLHQNRGERRLLIPLREARKKWWWGDCLEGFFHQTRGREGESLLWWFFDPFPSKYASKQATKYDAWIWSIQSDHNNIFLLSLCNLNPPLNSSAPPPLLMIYWASWLLLSLLFILQFSSPILNSVQLPQFSFRSLISHTHEKPFCLPAAWDFLSLFIPLAMAAKCSSTWVLFN